jgi:hypothetical protein
MKCPLLTDSFGVIPKAETSEHEQYLVLGIDLSILIVTARAKPQSQKDLSPTLFFWKRSVSLQKSFLQCVEFNFFENVREIRMSTKGKVCKVLLVPYASTYISE